MDNSLGNHYRRAWRSFNSRLLLSLALVSTFPLLLLYGPDGWRVHSIFQLWAPALAILWSYVTVFLGMAMIEGFACPRCSSRWPLGISCEVCGLGLWQMETHSPSNGTSSQWTVSEPDRQTREIEWKTRYLSFAFFFCVSLLLFLPMFLSPSLIVRYNTIQWRSAWWTVLLLVSSLFLLAILRLRQRRRIAKTLM
ncbi:MAG TPA: hypothetical protein VFW40_06950 [Capsulimonadaceae bacterium]|nr:hypothetical protein [Capsulimonadaceae bacterium]